MSHDFVGNYIQGKSDTHGGAIYNEGTIGNITGNFISNQAEQVGNQSVRGGALYNKGQVGDIIGDFINNSLSSTSSYVLGGAIANDTSATIEQLQGSFIGNSIATTAADKIARGGAISTRTSLTFKSGGSTQIISGNTTQTADGTKDYNAIYVADTGKYITFDTSSGGAWVLNDTIDVGGATSANTSNTFHFVATGDDTVNEGTTTQYVVVNNALINTKYVNVENTTLKFGAYTHEENSDTVLHASGRGEFVSADGEADTSLRLTNAVFDLANGYRDVVSLNKFEVMADDAGIYNGYVHLNLDIANSTSDVLYVDDTISGTTKLILHANSDSTTDGKFYFAYSNNDYSDGSNPLDAFKVYRVYKSPYMFDINYAASGDENFVIKDTDKEGNYNNAWYLTMNDTVNNGQFVEDDTTGGDDNTGTGGDDNTGTGGDDNTGTGGDDNTGTGGDDNTGTGGDDNSGNNNGDISGGDSSSIQSNAPIKVYPEVMAAIALPTAALTQSDGMVDNIMRNVAGLYSLKVRPTTNIWADTDYISANTKAPVEVESKVWGLESGLDLQTDIYNKLGVFVSYRQGTHDITGKGDKYYSTTSSEIEIDSYLAGLYYYHHKRNFYTFANVYGGIQQADITTSDGISFDTDGMEFGAGIEFGYTIGFANDFVLTPSLGVSYKHISYDDTNDNIAGKEYSFGDVSQAQAEATLKFSKAYNTTIGFGELYVKPGVVQTFNLGDDVKVTDMSEIEAIDDMTLGSVEIGAQHNINSNFSLNAWGTYTFGSDYDSTAAGLGLRYSW